MTTFPDWTGPEAVRRLNAAAGKNCYFNWPGDCVLPQVQALQQLMVDLNMQPPKDEAEELWLEICDACHWAYLERPRGIALPLIRAALAKAAGA